MTMGCALMPCFNALRTASEGLSTKGHDSPNKKSSTDSVALMKELEAVAREAWTLFHAGNHAVLDFFLVLVLLVATASAQQKNKAHFNMWRLLADEKWVWMNADGLKY